jgi:HJR/Mrr/RecB family endonuclease
MRLDEYGLTRHEDLRPKGVQLRRFGSTRTTVGVRSMEQTPAAKGDAFRNQIRDLCIAAGFTPMVETKTAGKRADVVFELFAQPRKKRIAVEAKAYNRALRKSDISELIGDYVRATTTREVDEIWVVSEGGFSSEAQDAIEKQCLVVRMYSEIEMSTRK